MMQSHDTVEVEIIPNRCEFKIGPIQQPGNKLPQFRGNITIMAKTVFEGQDIILTKQNVPVKDFLKILKKLGKSCFAALRYVEQPMETDSGDIPVIDSEYQYIRVAPQRKTIPQRKYEPMSTI